MELKVKWQGFKEFEELFKEIQNDFGEKDSQNILRNSLRQAMKPVLETSRNLLQSHGNVDTGQLLKSLQLEARKPTGRDKRSKYVDSNMIAIARVTVAPGSKFEPDKKLTSKTFKNKKTGEREHMHSDARAYAIEFGTVRWLKGEGRPFIRPALESNIQAVTGSLVVSLRNALLKYKSKHMNKK